MYSYKSPILSTAQTRNRLPWVVAFASLLLIWTLWSTGVPLNPTSAESNHPMDHLGSAPTEGKEILVGPIPVATASPPRFKSFDSWKGHEKDTNFVTDRPLILYAFFDTELARKNLNFYIQHGLHNNADFLFILNGDTDAENLLPVAGNIRFVKRKNDCYDLGAFAEVLTTNDLYKKYKKYITMNSSIRGPFIPYWSQDCWSERYLSKLNTNTKLVGMSMSCEYRVHVQSMIWATDRVGMEILLFPSENLVAKYTELLGEQNQAPLPKMKHAGINSCPHEYWDAVAIEVYATGLLKAAGYKVDPMMMAYHSNPNYETDCKGTVDLQGHQHYFGMDFHPYDTIFIKTNRGNDPLVIDRFTEWTDKAGYSSHNVCDSK